MFEIEIKAWDKKTAETEKIVASFADYECFFDKTDIYYKQTAAPKQNVRLRIEKSFSEKSETVEKNWVTYKQKEKLPGGVEVNKEIEFYKQRISQLEKENFEMKKNLQNGCCRRHYRHLP